MDEFRRSGSGTRLAQRGQEWRLQARRLASALLRRHVEELGSREPDPGERISVGASYVRELRGSLAECIRGGAGHRAAAEHAAEVCGVHDSKGAARLAEFDGVEG